MEFQVRPVDNHAVTERLSAWRTLTVVFAAYNPCWAIALSVVNVPRDPTAVLIIVWGVCGPHLGVISFQTMKSSFEGHHRVVEACHHPVKHPIQCKH